MLSCNLTYSGKRIRYQFIKAINNQKYQKELLKVALDNMPLGELAKVVHKLEAVKLSTNVMQNLSSQVDVVNKIKGNQSQCGRGANHGGNHGRG